MKTKKNANQEYLKVLKESLVSLDNATTYKGPAEDLLGFDGGDLKTHKNVTDVVSILEKMYKNEEASDTGTLFETADSDDETIASGEGPTGDAGVNNEPDVEDLSDVANTSGEGQSEDAGSLPNGADDEDEGFDTAMDADDSGTTTESLFEEYEVIPPDEKQNRSRVIRPLNKIQVTGSAAIQRMFKSLNLLNLPHDITSAIYNSGKAILRIGTGKNPEFIAAYKALVRQAAGGRIKSGKEFNQALNALYTKYGLRTYKHNESLFEEDAEPQGAIEDNENVDILGDEQEDTDFVDTTANGDATNLGESLFEEDEEMTDDNEESESDEEDTDEVDESLFEEDEEAAGDEDSEDEVIVDEEDESESDEEDTDEVDESLFEEDEEAESEPDGDEDGGEADSDHKEPDGDEAEEELEVPPAQESLFEEDEEAAGDEDSEEETEADESDKEPATESLFEEDEESSTDDEEPCCQDDEDETDTDSDEDEVDESLFEEDEEAAGDEDSEEETEADESDKEPATESLFEEDEEAQIENDNGKVAATEPTEDEKGEAEIEESLLEGSIIARRKAEENIVNRLIREMKNYEDNTTDIDDTDWLFENN